MSFRLKTVLGIATIEIVLLCILVFSGLYYIQSSNERQLQDRAFTTVKLLATMTTDSIIATDIATLDALVNESLKNPGIVYVKIRARDGTILSKGGVVENTVTQWDSAKEKNLKRPHQIIASYPIELHGANFGYVELALSTIELKATLANATRWMLGVAAAEIILVAVFGYLLGKILTRQLSALQTGAKRLADGEIGYQIPVHGNDELAGAAKSFNRMSRSLSNYSKQLKYAKSRAEQAQKFAETTLQDAIISISEGVVIVSGDGAVLQINDVFKDIHNFDNSGLKEVTAKAIENALEPYIIYAISGFATIEQLENANKDQAIPPLPNWLSNPKDDGQWTIKYRNGVTVIYSISRMIDNGHIIIASNFTEIYHSEINARRLQQELMQRQKLEAIGTLSGGIAHELNTPIQFIGDNLAFISSITTELA